MKRFFACAIFLLALSSRSLPQQNSDIHQQTTTPVGARFEIIQSELSAKWTFRLDRFTGHISQLVKTKDDDDSWEEITVISLPAASAPFHPRFQIFASGIAARFTFLIDTESGKTWVLVGAKRKSQDGTEYDYSYWSPFVE